MEELKKLFQTISVHAFQNNQFSQGISIKNNDFKNQKPYSLKLNPLRRWMDPTLNYFPNPKNSKEMLENNYIHTKAKAPFNSLSSKSSNASKDRSSKSSISTWKRKLYSSNSLVKLFSVTQTTLTDLFPILYLKTAITHFTKDCF